MEFLSEFVFGSNPEAWYDLAMGMLILVTTLLLRSASTGFTYYYLYGTFIVYRAGMLGLEVV